MKKRIVSIVLALSLIAGFALPALADDEAKSKATITFKDGELEFVTDEDGKLAGMDFPFGIKDRPLGAKTYKATAKTYQLSVQDNRGTVVGDRNWAVTVKMAEFTFSGATPAQEFIGSITVPGTPKLSALNLTPGDAWGIPASDLVIDTVNANAVVSKSQATTDRDIFNLDWADTTQAKLAVSADEAKKEIVLNQEYTAEVTWTLADVV